MPYSLSENAVVASAQFRNTLRQIDIMQQNARALLETTAATSIDAPTATFLTALNTYRTAVLAVTPPVPFFGPNIFPESPSE